MLVVAGRGDRRNGVIGCELLERGKARLADVHTRLVWRKMTPIEFWRMEVPKLHVGCLSATYRQA
jgi:hypothetical protein